MKRIIPLFLAAALLPAAVVRIEKTADGHRLLRDGKPYFVKGAVGARFLDKLQEAGGNSIRAGANSLDEAQRRGLTVLVNLPLQLPRRGFDYSDRAAVQAQLERTRETVRKWKDHPAVLMWALGNELEIHTTAEQRRHLWRAKNELAEMIHKEDPNHPVITVIGGDYRRWRLLEEIREQAPALDAIGLNAYADMLTMPEDVAAQGWTKPYIVTEFGPVGHWQVPKTAWKMPIEQNSSEKAAYYRKAYEHAVNRPRCLGSYVFYWNYKQEKTHTWYGLFLDDGSSTEAVDVMQFMWTGKWPANRTPGIEPIRIDGHAGPNVFAPGSTLKAVVAVRDPEGDALAITWDLRIDVADHPGVGGDAEPDAPPIAGAIVSSSANTASVRLPEKPGPYRLFVYARDGKGHVATANLPVLAK